MDEVVVLFQKKHQQDKGDVLKRQSFNKIKDRSREGFARFSTRVGITQTDIFE